jgi:hypothetical protein
MSMREKIRNFKKLLLLIDDDEEDDLLALLVNKRPYSKVSKLFACRKTEGAFHLTVERRLFGNEKQFRGFFRLSTDLFGNVLQHITKDIVKTPYQRHMHPISPEEKLSIALRLVLFFKLQKIY